MNTLSTYLWKEWREQRATLGVLAAVLLAGVTAVVAVLPAKHADDPLVFQGAIAIASTGSDLLARERSGPGLGFLERAPAGLAMAFRAKLVFFALALFSAATYGALLATAAALLRSGELPQRLLDGPSPWLLAILLGVSLWVFAVSAWMPASALTFPGTVLLLAALAWPAVLAANGDPLYKPTPSQVLVFAFLCLAGAPISAWAAFVLGSRRGRSRRWASIAGLSVAAIFFAPAWAWAAGRYSSLVNASFEILQGWVGPNGRHAFLTLTRRPPQRVPQDQAHGWENRCTAVLVDLKQHAWQIPGSMDASAFIEDMSRQSRRVRCDERLVLKLQLVDSNLGAVDYDHQSVYGTNTAQLLSLKEIGATHAQDPSPLDFGLSVVPRTFSLYWSGLGHRLSFLEESVTGDKHWTCLYRNLAGTIVVERDSIVPRDNHGNSEGEVRIRPGRWLVRIGKKWYSVDPITCQRDPLSGFREGDSIGPILEDGRVLLASGGAAYLLDPDTGQRIGLTVTGRGEFEVDHIDRFGVPSGAVYPLPVDRPTILGLWGPRAGTLGLLDVPTNQLRIQSTDVLMPAAILWSNEREAILVEEHLRLVRYDFASDENEVLFSVEELD
jgi:hypothetical protein